MFSLFPRFTQWLSITKLSALPGGSTSFSTLSFHVSFFYNNNIDNSNNYSNNSNVILDCLAKLDDFEDDRP